MVRALLIHGGSIPHYRVPIYSHLSRYLERYGFELCVASNGIQLDNPNPVDFKFTAMPLSVLNIGRLVFRQRIDVLIMFVDMRHCYLFPTYFIAKGLLRRKMVWWGQGRDLADRDSIPKNLAYGIEHALCDSIILYAEHLKKYVAHCFHKKIFVANNTLCVKYPGLGPGGKEKVLADYGIHTRKNIICVGRLQKRKRLDHLVRAFKLMDRPDIGLILVGPDSDGILDAFQGENIFKLGSVYGTKIYDLLSASDVFCLPGAVGLSIIDAFYCGLPFVTEDGDESAEIAYLRNGENGFIVPRGDVVQLASKLLLLLDDDVLRERFSGEAKREVAENANIDKLCSGFRDALCYALGASASVRAGCLSVHTTDANTSTGKRNWT